MTEFQLLAYCVHFEKVPCSRLEITNPQIRPNPEPQTPNSNNHSLYIYFSLNENILSNFFLRRPASRSRIFHRRFPPSVVPERHIPNALQISLKIASTGQRILPNALAEETEINKLCEN